MPKQPRKPRAIKRATGAKPERIASRIVSSRPDLRRPAPDMDRALHSKACATAPPGPTWLHEIKHDGYRTVCVIDQGNISIYTRRGDRRKKNAAQMREARKRQKAGAPTRVRHPP
jgi:ATP-dependent DNA ligase